MVKIIKAYQAEDGTKFFSAEEAAMHDHLSTFARWYSQTEGDEQPNALSRASSAFPAANSREMFEWLMKNREFISDMLNKISLEIQSTQISYATEKTR